MEFGYRKCTNIDCQKVYPATTEYFYTQKGSKSGLASWCKQCQIESQMKYYKKNREELLPKKRKWREENKEIVNERAKLWKIENYGKWKEYYKQWQQSEEGKRLAKISTQYRDKNKKHKISKKEWKECKEYFDCSCCYCGLPEEIHKEIFKEQLHKDHYDPNGSNEIDNCVPACKMCNSKKHTTSGDEWYSSENENYTEGRRVKINKWLLFKSKVSIN